MIRIPVSAVSVLPVALLALGAFAQPPSPPKHAGPPLPPHAVSNRAFQGISSLAVAPNGRLWVTWYAGFTPGEDHNNYAVLSTSGDGGVTWKELLTVDPDGEGPRRAFDPEVWLAPDGKLRWTWTDRTMPFDNVASDALWMIVLDDPASERTAWHPPVYVAQGVMMCKPIVLSSGEWALPVSTWYAENSSKMVISADGGKTWSVRGGAGMPKEDRCFDEHLFVERKNGWVWCLARTKSGIREAVSTDRGKTWTPLEPSAIRHPSARFFITRLKSGNLLLVKHGPVGEKTGRSHLTAFVSADDGKTWGGGLLIDGRGGVSYPDGQQAPDGTIYLTYDYNRTSDRQILFAAFREEDATAGKDVSGTVRLRQTVSQASGGLKKPSPAAPAQTGATPPALPGTEYRYLDGLADPKRWSPAECETSVSSRSAEGRPCVRMHIPVDFSAGEKNYPIGWPRMYLALKPGEQGWLEYDRFEFQLFTETPRASLPKHPLNLQIHGAGGQKKNVILDLATIGAAKTFTMNLSDLGMTGGIERLGFNISESAYCDKDVVDFHLGGFRLARATAALVTQLKAACPALFCDSRVLPVEMVVEGPAEKVAAGLPVQLRKGDRTVLAKTVPVSRGRQTLYLPLTGAELEPGAHTLAVCPDTPGLRKEITVTLLSSPYRSAGVPVRD
ncbi:MAG: sialidase family protein [Kiritimatiellae bacterium]|nr:sialidase family protein [Kiritimatiellia bacterium]